LHHHLTLYIMKNLLILFLIACCFLIDATFGSFAFFSYGMALIRFSDVVSEARGSIGGTTFSRNKSGAIARKRTKPVNTQSTFRDNVRALFGAIAQEWRDLTPAQRDNWNTMAPEYQAVNALGEDFVYSGSQLFQKLNSSLRLAGLPGITAIGAPSEVDPNNVTGVTADIAGPEIEVALSAATPAGTSIIIEATPQVSAGKSNVANLFKQIAVIDNADGSAVDVNDDYEARYGVSVANMPEGSVIYFRFTLVMNANGQRGVPVTIRAVVEDSTP
jgi:hypothetical protein